MRDFSVARNHHSKRLQVIQEALCVFDCPESQNGPRAHAGFCPLGNSAAATAPNHPESRNLLCSPPIFPNGKNKDTPLTNEGMLKILGPEVEEVLTTIDSKFLNDAFANDNKRRNPCP